MDSEEKEKIIEQDKEKMNNIVRRSDINKKEMKEVKILVVVLFLVILGVGFYFLNNKYEYIKFGNKKEEPKSEEKNNTTNNTKKSDDTIKKNMTDDKVKVYRNNGKIYIEKDGKKEFFMNEPKDSENGNDYLYENGKLYYYYMTDNTDSPYILNYIDVETKKIYKNVATLKVEANDKNYNSSYSGIEIYSIKNNYIYYGYNLVNNKTNNHSEIVAKYDMETKKSKILMNVKNIVFIKGGGGFFSPNGQYFFDKLYVFIGKENTSDRALYTIDKNDKIELIDDSTGIVAGYNAGSSYITKIGDKLYYLDVNAKEYNPKTKKLKVLFNIGKNEYLSNGKTEYYKKGLISLGSENKLYYYDGSKSQTFTIKLSEDVQKTLCYDLDEDNEKKIYRDCEDDEKNNYAWSMEIKDDNIYIVLYPTYDEVKLSIKNLKDNVITITKNDIIPRSENAEDSDLNNDYELIA